MSVFIGRKTEIQIGSLLYMLGGFVEALSSNPTWDANTGISVLIFGRIIYGLGIGFSMHGAPAYIGEMSPPSIRGLLISLKEAVIVVGILFGYLIGFLLSDTKGGWAYVFGAAICPAAFMFCGSFLLHESARWLYLNGRVTEATVALQWVLPQEMVEAALADMVTQDSLLNTRDPTSNSKASREAFALQAIDKPSVWDKRYRPALIAGLLFVIHICMLSMRII